jgi:hypothetical protein
MKRLPMFLTYVTGGILVDSFLYLLAHLIWREKQLNLAAGSIDPVFCGKSTQRFGG